MKKVLTALLSLFLLFLFVPTTHAATEIFEQVTAAEQLSPGDRIILVAAWYDKAMSTTQKATTRGDVAISKQGNLISHCEGLQVITLEVGTIPGTWCLRVEDGYLCASSSSANHLKTTPTRDDNSSWFLTFQNGEATIIAQGNYTRNVLQYHANSSIFSCYASATQSAITIYKSISAAKPTGCDHKNVKLVPNSDHTHSTVCQNPFCPDPILQTESCRYSVIDQKNGCHSGSCICGNTGIPALHTFSSDSYHCFCGAIGYPSSTITIPQLKAMAALLGSETTYERYQMTGTVTANLSITDPLGNTLSIAGIPNASGYQVGDTLTLSANISGSGLVNAVVTSHIPHQCTHQDNSNDFLCDHCGTLLPPPSDSVLTIAQALQLGNCLPNSSSPNHSTDGKYYITGQVILITDNAYGTLLLADEKGNHITVNGISDAHGHVYADLIPQPAVGNTVTVYGIIDCYQSSVQIKNAILTIHDAHVCDYAPADCQTPQTCKICGSTTGTPLGHDLSPIPALPPTQDAEGYLAHWSCYRCGKLFLDGAGTTETTQAALRLEKLPANETEPSQQPTEPAAHPTPSSDLDLTMIIVCGVFLAAMIAALLILMNRKE